MKSYKVTILGDAAVGKTSLRKNFMGETYKQTYSMTIGADFAAYKTGDYNLHIWDIAGQARFNSVIQSYFNGTRGSLIVFDLTRPKSFKNIPNWIEQLVKNLNNEMVPVVLVGNKYDLVDQTDNIVSIDAAKEYATQLSEWIDFEVPFYVTSAVTGKNVDDAFMKLINLIEIDLGLA